MFVWFGRAKFALWLGVFGRGNHRCNRDENKCLLLCLKPDLLSDRSYMTLGDDETGLCSWRWQLADRLFLTGDLGGELGVLLAQLGQPRGLAPPGSRRRGWGRHPAPLFDVAHRHHLVCPIGFGTRPNAGQGGGLRKGRTDGRTGGPQPGTGEDQGGMSGYLRTAVLLAGLTALFVGVGYLAGGRQGMLIAFLVACGTNLWAWWNSDRVVLSMHNAQPIGPQEAPRLHQIVAGLAANAGLPMPALYVIHEDQPNAFATGRNPQNAAVAVNTGLLDLLTEEEVAGVIAHELAHVRNRDTLVDLLRKTDYRDFGKEVFPASVRARHVQAHLFDGYWEDIGTIRSFYEANLALARPDAPFNLATVESPIYSHARFLPPTRIEGATVSNSLVADGSMIEAGATIENSIIGIRCRIGRGAVVRDSIIMGNDCYEMPQDLPPDAPPLGIGAGAFVHGAIIDKNCRIGRDARIENRRGLDHTDDNQHCVVRDGIVVLPKHAVLPDGWSI